MARKAKELTALAVERLRPPGLHAVEGVAGPYLRVLIDRRTGEPTGARTWIIRYLSPTKLRPGREGEKLRCGFGLGATVNLGSRLPGPRAKAREARDAVRSGKDPIEEAAISRGARRAIAQRPISFQEAAAGYVHARKVSWTQGNEEAWERTLKQCAIEPDAEEPARKRSAARLPRDQASEFAEDVPRESLRRLEIVQEPPRHFGFRRFEVQFDVRNMRW